MTLEQSVGAWAMFAAGFLACCVVLLIAGVVSITRDGRRGGDRGGRSRPEAGCKDGSCRRGEGSPRRFYREEVVDQFLAGLITIDDMRDFYEGRRR